MPSLRVEIVGCVPETRAGWWRVSWRLHNDGPHPVQFQAAWVPHGRFRGEGRVDLSGEPVPTGGNAPLSLSVASSGDPGEIVDNAFLIVRVGCDGRVWRIFVRMRVAFDARAIPTPIVELVTVQPVASR